MRFERVCILGGTGFVGRHLVSALHDSGLRSRVLCRHPQRHRQLEVTPGLRLVQADVHDPEQLRQHLDGCDAVVNLVGILNEGRRNSFERVHVELAEKVIDACRGAGITRLLHMSALNADASSGSSRYLRTKGEGENRAHTLGQPDIRVTSFRPSVIFGPDDSFFNRFAALLRLAPLVFPLACPKARFAPVYVGDVAEAFARSLGDANTFGKHYNLCGPREFELRELVEYAARMLGLRRRVVGLNDALSRLQARLLGLVPGKPFSYDNYLSLQLPSVCKDSGLADLGITPVDVEEIMPLSLGQGRQRQRYQELRRT